MVSCIIQSTPFAKQLIPMLSLHTIYCTHCQPLIPCMWGNADTSSQDLFEHPVYTLQYHISTYIIWTPWQDWWNSTSYARFYRTWNCVVHDWLYEYVYRDMVNWQVSFQTWLPEMRCLLITGVLPLVSIIREVNVVAIQNCMYCTVLHMCTCPCYIVFSICVHFK